MLWRRFWLNNDVIIYCIMCPLGYIYFRDASIHYSDVIMGAIASQITSLTIVYSSVYSGADQRKNQSSTSLAFVRGIHRWPVNSPHKGPVTRKLFPFDDVIMVDSYVGKLPLHTLLLLIYCMEELWICICQSYYARSCCNLLRMHPSHSQHHGCYYSGDAGNEHITSHANHLICRE